uniref:G-protein coupled receptors family 1 profile domain-containing protein n=1 Tax=Callorhinchus milii TaxID=7868 RepID=A0A4W3GT48_CALMI
MEFEFWRRLLPHSTAFSSSTLSDLFQSNILAIVILCRGRCGLSKCISRYLVAMTVADLMAVIITVIFVRIVYFHFPNSFVSITHICRLISFLDCTTRSMSVWLTVAFTFDRYVAFCCPKFKTKYCTEKTALRVIAVLALIFFVENFPWYFVYVPQYIVNDTPSGCQYKPSYQTSLSWIVFDWLHVILTPFLPFVLILLRLRRNSDGDRNRGASGSDPEMRKRKKSIILLFAVSANFILLWITFVLFFLYWRISKINYYTGYNDPLYIIWRTAFMLVYLSCCTNTCIYAVTQTKFRAEIRKACLCCSVSVCVSVCVRFYVQMCVSVCGWMWVCASAYILVSFCGSACVFVYVCVVSVSVWVCLCV